MFESSESVDLRYHGDVAAAGARLDFAVNVIRPEPPQWLQDKLFTAISSLAKYPTAELEAAAIHAVATRHGRSPDEVLLLAGAAEAFALLANLNPDHPVVAHPSFTEPEAALRAAGCEVTPMIMRSPYALRVAQVPATTDMFVIGNPTNPTSVLHRAADLIELAERLTVVVDESFADCIPGEPESLASVRHPNLVVVRSLTKQWGLAGLRCGYLLADPSTVGSLAARRPPWPLNSLALIAIEACMQPDAMRDADARARELVAHQQHLVNRLRDIGFSVADPDCGAFVLAWRKDGAAVRNRLATKGIAVRRCDTFPGLTPAHLRIAVRDKALTDELIDAIEESE